MPSISEQEFARIFDGIVEDREVIIRHNPIGTPEETLLWMTMSSLILYLNLTDLETPCFPGSPDADSYRDAIRFILAERMTPPFDPEIYLSRLSNFN